MISGSNNSINWELLTRQVDPRHNQPDRSIDTRTGRAIEVDANYAENSMAVLNNEQKDNKKRLEERYKDNQLDPNFCHDCDNQIKQYILNGYANNPAIVNGLALPLEYDEDLNFSIDVQQAYFQNPWHTAYRYFVLKIDNKPNLWMHPDAEYMGNLLYEGEYYKTPQIQDNYRALIRAMWVAVNDPEFTLSEMHTPESAKEELINVLAALGRAHNWDQTRSVTRQVKGLDNVVRDVQIEEEYDNLDLDLPSCPWGVEQRLTQFVMLVLKEDANERTLNTLILRTKFVEEMVSEIEGKNTLFGAISKMDLPTLTKLNEALLDLVVINTGDFDSLEDEQKALLKQIQCYSTRDIEQFINGCKAYYGSFRLTQALKQNVKYQHLIFQNYGQLALAFARNPWELFYDQISNYIAQRITALGGNVNNQVKDDDSKDNSVSDDKEDNPLEQDTEVLRQQLIELAIRERKNDILEQLFIGDETFIKQKALQYKAQLPQKQEQSNTTTQASTLPQTSTSVQTGTSVQASMSMPQEEEGARQEMLEYAFEHGNQALAEQMLEAPIEIVLQAREDLRKNLAQLEADLAFARRLEEQEASDRPEEQPLQQEAATSQALAFAEVVERHRHQIAQSSQQNVLAAPPSFTPARSQSVIRAQEVPTLNPGLAGLFQTELAMQLLECINQNPVLVDNLNHWDPALIERLVKGLATNAKVDSFKTMNTATKIGFIERFETAFKPKAAVLAH